MVLLEKSHLQIVTLVGAVLDLVDTCALRVKARREPRLFAPFLVTLLELLLLGRRRRRAVVRNLRRFSTGRATRVSAFAA